MVRVMLIIRARTGVDIAIRARVRVSLVAQAVGRDRVVEYLTGRPADQYPRHQQSHRQALGESLQ